MEKTLKPRCPRCGKVQADWVTEAQFTCRRCHLVFVVGDPSKGEAMLECFLPLTSKEKRGSVFVK